MVETVQREAPRCVILTKRYGGDINVGVMGGSCGNHGEKRNTRIPEGNGATASPRHRHEADTKINLKAIGGAWTGFIWLSSGTSCGLL
jgi:hypothetical protein